MLSVVVVSAMSALSRFTMRTGTLTVALFSNRPSDRFSVRLVDGIKADDINQGPSAAMIIRGLGWLFMGCSSKPCMLPFLLIHILIRQLHEFSKRDCVLGIEARHPDTEGQFVTRFAGIGLLERLFQAAEDHRFIFIGSFHHQ